MTLPDPVSPKASGGVMAEIGKEASCERGPGAEVVRTSAKDANRRDEIQEIPMTKAELVAELVAACKHALKLLEPFDDPELSLGLGSNALSTIRTAIAKAEASRLTPSAIGAEGWRPIETAEIEEGADVLLFIPDGDPQVTIGHWMGGDTIDWFPSEVTTFNGEAFDTEPTHWQPLPAPPTAQEGK